MGTSCGELTGTSGFFSGLELSNGLAETGHIHNAGFFLIKEHIQHVSVQVLPTHSHPAAMLRKLLALP